MHERRRIRETLMSLLRTGLSVMGCDPVQRVMLDVGGRVYSNRVTPLGTTDLPACVVLFKDENDDVDNSRVLRKWNVDVNLVVEMRDGFEDELDRLSWQVEVILTSDPRVWEDTGVNRVLLTSTSPYNHQVDGDQHMGVCRLSFSVEYEQDILTPGTLADFLRAKGSIETTDGAVNEFSQSLEAS